jgi:hypothetical protein
LNCLYKSHFRSWILTDTTLALLDIAANMRRMAEGTEQTARLNGLKIRQTPDRVLWVQLPFPPHPSERIAHVKSEPDEIVLHILRQQQRMIRELCRNDLLLIESILSGQDDQEGLAAAAAIVRATLYSLDALGDKILSLDS